MRTEAKFVLYLERIMGATVPQNRRTKALLFQIRAELTREKRFTGRAELIRVVDHLVNFLD